MSSKVTVKKPCFALPYKVPHPLALAYLFFHFLPILPLPLHPPSSSSYTELLIQCPVFASAISPAGSACPPLLLIKLLLTLQNPVHVSPPLCETLLDCPCSLCVTLPCWDRSTPLTWPRAAPGRELGLNLFSSPGPSR